MRSTISACTFENLITSSVRHLCESLSDSTVTAGKVRYWEKSVEKISTFLLYSCINILQPRSTVNPNG